ncbi:MAG: HlyD family efflux transporter periplasmic adaptor subunit [Vicinamibacterales bacterium]
MSQTSHWDMDQRLALHGIHAPRSARVLARLLVGLVAVLAVGLVITPWQQTIPGAGRVTAFSPDERPQEVQALVDGRVVRWHVVEGSVVKAGDPVVELADNDPSIIERITTERDQARRAIEQADSRAAALADRVSGLLTAQQTAIAAARLRVDMARERVRAAEQARTAAEAARTTAALNIDRQRALIAKGLTSTRTVELAELEAATRNAEVDRAIATLNAARSEASSLEAELQRTTADAETRVDEGRASLASARSDAAKARAELAKVDVRLARQQTQRVVAPIDGTVLRVMARRSGELMKAGEPLAIIVPASTKDVVELWVDGNDMPMVLPGSPVRLQFEGWPALQFSGWPSIAVGTFGGRVLSVDAADNGRGEFRLLVEADPGDAPWPSARFLRQGVRANGWVMLNVVPVWFELWRQFNGFPPVVAMAEPTVSAAGGKKSAGSSAEKDEP